MLVYCFSEAISSKFIIHPKVTKVDCWPTCKKTMEFHQKWLRFSPIQKVPKVHDWGRPALCWAPGSSSWHHDGFCIHIHTDIHMYICICIYNPLMMRVTWKNRHFKRVTCKSCRLVDFEVNSGDNVWWQVWHPFACWFILLSNEVIALITPIISISKQYIAPYLPHL